MYKFSAQQLASSGKQPIFNFRVMAVRDIKLRTRLSKTLYLSRDFRLFRSERIRKSTGVNACFFFQFRQSVA